MTERLPTKAEIKEELVATRAVLSERGSWCQGTLARDKQGHRANPKGPTAVKWCLWGAYSKATNLVWGSSVDLSQTGWGLLEQVQGRSHFPSLMDWNDRPSRTRPQVLKLIDRALALAEALPE
jgi:hypothetical protein